MNCPLTCQLFGVFGILSLNPLWKAVIFERFNYLHFNYRSVRGKISWYDASRPTSGWRDRCANAKQCKAYVVNANTILFKRPEEIL